MNAALGLWLFVSAFLWPHSATQRANATIVGLLVVALALAGLAGLRGARYLNAALGGWLVVSALFLPGLTQMTFWNHVVVGVAVALFALAPSLRNARERGPVPV